MSLSAGCYWFEIGGLTEGPSFGAGSDKLINDLKIKSKFKALWKSVCPPSRGTPNSTLESGEGGGGGEVHLKNLLNRMNDNCCHSRLSTAS